MLLVVALVLGILSAAACVIGSIALFQKLEKQAETLAKLSAHTLAEQEKAARRFSQEMHDEFGQSLNAIESLLTVVRAGNPDSQTRLNEARALTKETQVLAREMSHLLRPRILDDFGLDAAMRELAEGFSRRTGIAVNYGSNLRERLKPVFETQLFRIAQEALTNVSRHTMATAVNVSLKCEDEHVLLSIVDNGGGLTEESAPSGLGILGMQERARLLGARFSLASAAGRGVEIQVELPIQEALPLVMPDNSETSSVPEGGPSTQYQEEIL
jgi:two-component system sensor histidine kinase UhpB